MKKSPPKWHENLNSKLFTELISSTELRSLLARAQEKYVTWEVFRHYKFPQGVKPVEAWALLKVSERLGKEQSPIKAMDGLPFGFTLTKSLHRKLSIIDTHANGLIKSLSTDATSAQKEQLIISGLTEEAIASSQIEGANTSRKVAKEMLYSGRKARNTSEQMIINNYQVMQLIGEWKDLDLSEEMLLDIQRRITNRTLEEADAGRFRLDSDNIAVVDQATGEITFVPPKEEEMRRELKRLIEFANETEKNDGAFLHPFVKAAMLHFWVGYLHPFVDGNGRTARAIFYWYLLKNGYWLFEYLAVSRIIKASKKRYDDAFEDAETDDNDLTYFLVYIADATCKAIDEMTQYYQRKLKEAAEIKKSAAEFSGLNERQIALLSHFAKKPDDLTSIKRHRSAHGVSYESARLDLLELVKKGLLVEAEQGKRKKIFLPNRPKIKKLLA